MWGFRQGLSLTRGQSGENAQVSNAGRGGSQEPGLCDGDLGDEVRLLLLLFF